MIFTNPKDLCALNHAGHWEWNILSRGEIKYKFLEVGAYLHYL